MILYYICRQQGHTQMITNANDIKCYEDLMKLTDDAWEQLMDIVDKEVDAGWLELENDPTSGWNKLTSKKTMSHKIG